MFQLSNCTKKDAAYICDRLDDYNVSQVPQIRHPLSKNIYKKLTDETGRIVAGCLASIYCWNALSVHILWVDETCRKSGLGSRLLREMEAIARAENCDLIHLDTFDFQAKNFYLKHGYEVFGVLEDFPQGHKRYYLKKKLL